MATPFTVLLDAPADARSRLQIARLGEFDGGNRYGEFSITRNDVEAWQRNLDYLPGKRALIDLDHRADRQPRNTEAAGWITGIGWDGDTPVADVEWTPVGEQAIKDKRYLFFSPTYGEHKTEDGEVHANTLIGGALTNRPFLTGMPAITLASEETIQTAVDELERENNQRLLDTLTSKPADADSRRLMPTETTTIPESLIKTLDLDAGADETAIVEAITKLQTKAREGKQATKAVKTLEQLASEKGMIVLDASEVRTLQTQAAAGEAAMKQLHEQRFENAFELALNHADGAKVLPAEKASLQHFYTLDADATIKLIEDREPLVSAKPKGQPALQLDADADPAQVAAAGVHPGSHDLHSRINKYLLDNKLPQSHYIKVLEQLNSGAVAL